MYCRNCGNKFDDNATVCPACGAPTSDTVNNATQPDIAEMNAQMNAQQQPQNSEPPQYGYQQPPYGAPNNGQNGYQQMPPYPPYPPYNAYQPPVQNPDSGNKVGWGFLCFFFPIVGLILFLTWRKERPKTAKVCGICALVSVIVSSVLFIIRIIPAIALFIELLLGSDYAIGDYFTGLIQMIL